MRFPPLTIARKFVLILGLFLVLQLVQLGLGVVGMLHLGDEQAILERIGRQRVALLRLPMLVHGAARPGPGQRDRHAALAAALAAYEKSFLEHNNRSAQGTFQLRWYREHPATAFVASLHETWVKNLRPSAERVLAGGPGAMNAADHFDGLVLAQADVIESRLDRFDQHLHKDQRELVMFHLAIIAVTLLAVVSGFVVFRRTVTAPLRALTATSRAIADGAYERRVDIASRDELGELAASFNRMVEAVARHTARLGALNQVAVGVSSSLGLRDVLDRVMHEGCALTGAGAACIAFYDEETRSFTEWVTHGLSARFVQNVRFRPGGLAEEAFAAGAYLESNDRVGTRHRLSRLVRDEGICGFICLPLTSHSRRLGVIYFYRTDRDRFAVDEIDLLMTFSYLAAGAIENARLHTRVADEARTDPLTGLCNRREFDARLEAEFQRARRYGRPLALMMLDLDHFKRVNDGYGHAAGDAVLRHFAAMLRATLRDSDVAARLGGEEFAIILPEISAGAARPIAERLRQAVAKEAFRLPDGREIGVGVSIGLSCYPNCSDQPRRVVETADLALYVAKEAGRNRVVLYRETLKAQIERDPARVVALLSENAENLRPLITAIGSKAAFYRVHNSAVEDNALRLARALGLNAEEGESLRQAALLHDIGMSMIPDEVVNKTDPLSPADWAELRRHPAIAADWLEQVPALRHLAPVVRHHHERWDGSGYPDGLKGADTPRLARVLAVADAYAMMISDWPGQRAASPAEARQALTAAAGRQLDPEMVAALLRELDSGTPD